MDLQSLREKLLQNIFGRFILRAAAVFYGIGVRLNLFACKRGWRRSMRVNTRVVCIGNITTGGTGKTTAVLLAAGALARGGIRASIVSRGYKRKKAGDITILFDRETAPDWRETGDEPYMMSQLLAEYKVPVIVSADRYGAANAALKEFKSQVILLDDGMQHHRLRRDANIVLIDAKNPFGGNALLPYGTLREPVSALKRADLVVITHANLAPVHIIEDIKDKIRVINDEIDILTAAHKPDYFFDLKERLHVPLDRLAGDIAAFSAIGEPASFEQTLKNLGFNLKQAWRFADHATYTRADIENFAALSGGLPLITTFKDAVKLPEGWQDIIKGKVYILAVNMEIQDNGLNKFMDVLYPQFSKRK